MPSAVDRRPSSTVGAAPIHPLAFGARLVTGAARRAWISWRNGRLDLSPSIWLQHLRNYYREVAPKPPRFLVITDVVPTPDQDSGSFRLFHLLKALAEIGYDVALIADESQSPSKYVESLEELGVAVLLGRETGLDRLRSDGPSYRHIVLSRPEVAFRYLLAVRALAPQAHVTYDTVDLHWLRLRRGGELTGDLSMKAEADRYRRIERFNAEWADTVLAVT